MRTACSARLLAICLAIGLVACNGNAEDRDRDGLPDDAPTLNDPLANCQNGVCDEEEDCGICPEDCGVCVGCATADDGARWSDPATWERFGTSPPSAGGTVTIPAGERVCLDESPPPLAALNIEGTLLVDRQAIDVTTDRILVNGGVLEIGEPDAPHYDPLTITLTHDYATPATPMCGIKAMCAMGGRFEIHGGVRTPTWTRLADGHTAEAGANQLTLEQSVLWRVGDEIVITSTDFDPSQAEPRRITAISEDRRTITLDAPLSFMHFGEILDIEGHAVDQRAEVMLLTRDVRVQGDESSEDDLTGGHMMVMNAFHMEQMQLVEDGADWQDLWEEPRFQTAPEDQSHVRGVELYRMGQAGEIGRYPFHWHMVGHFGDSYIRDSSVHRSFNRCYTVHGTFDVTLENNVAYDAMGHCYFLESFVEVNNRLEHNIGAWVHDWSRPGMDLIESDNVPSVFWISHPTNHLIDNVSAGAMGQGIWIDLGDDSGHHALADEVMGEMRGNVAHSTMQSVRPEAGSNPKFDGGSGFFYEGGIGEINDLTVYKNMVNFWSQESSEFSIHDSVFADAHIGAWIRRYGIYDSVFVAHTANVGNPSTAEELAVGYTLPEYRRENPDFITGFMGFYSKSFSVRNTFIGFESDEDLVRGAFSTGSPSFDAPIWTAETTLVNSEAFAVTNDPRRPGIPERGAMVIDSDGSLTGSGPASEIRVGPELVTTSANGCVEHGVNNGVSVYRCPGRSRLTRISDDPLTITADGQTFSNTRAQWFENGVTYRVQDRLSTVDPYTREGFKGEWAVVVFPCGNRPTVQARTSRDSPVEVSTVAEVTDPSDDIVDQRWHYDDAAGELWVRLATGDKANHVGELSSTGVPQPYSPHMGVQISGCN